MPAGSPRAQAADRAAPARAAAPAHAALVAALALGIPAVGWAVAPTPGLVSMVFGDESAATADDARAALFNPAAASLRYPSEFVFAWERARPRGEVNHLLFARDGFAARVTRIKDSTEFFGASFARGSSERLRVGLGPTWLLDPRTHQVATDWRLGALTRPTPWLSLGGVAEHLFQSDFQSRRLGRAYDLAVGLRPLALARPVAHTLGTDLTLSADAVVPEDGEWSQTRVRVAVALEPRAGVLLRAAFQDHRGVQIGVGLEGVRGGLHARQAYRDGSRSSETYSVSIHEGEDASALASRGERRVAAVRVSGDLADERRDLPPAGGAGETTPVAPIHDQLERALADPLTRGVLLDVGDTSNLAQIEELRGRVAELRAKGKPVVAYLERGGTRGDLYLASDCDRIVTTPRATFDALARRADPAAPRKSPTDDRLLRQERELLVAAVSAARGLDHERSKALLDGPIGTASTAQRAGLVDSIGYREEALDALAGMCGLRTGPRVIGLECPRAARREWRVPTRVAVVYASGVIGSATLTREIESAFGRRGVRAVVLRIESPGGSALACDLVDHALSRMKRQTAKPLVISMGGIAAGGGYHIALRGDRLLADRFTRTGAIAAPADEASRALVAEVAEMRRLKSAAVDSAAGGRQWMGDGALAHGLVDEIGGLDRAIAEARRLAHIPAGEKIAIAEYRGPVADARERLEGYGPRALRGHPARLPESAGPLEWVDDEPAP